MAGDFSMSLRHPHRKPFIVPDARGAMSDGLSRLLRGDPKNLLSVEARKRIQRAIIGADKFIWEAEVLITNRHLDEGSHKARALRNTASFKKAKAALSVYRREFSRIDIPERNYREYMESEIEAASNSLGLSGAQRHLLETEFFFPEHKNAWPPPPEANPQIIPSLVPPKPETIGAQINRLREECHLTEEELAEKIDMDIRSVQRHLANKIKPYARHLRTYERVFSKLLNKQVVIRKMP